MGQVPRVLCQLAALLASSSCAIMGLNIEAFAQQDARTIILNMGNEVAQMATSLRRLPHRY